MGFKVFLSHSTDPSEQVIVWRLQTLAAAHGIELYVPQRPRFPVPSARRVTPPDEVRNAIDRSDCVLAIVTTRTSRYVEQELSYALGRKKVVIPVVEAGIKNGSFLKTFPHVFRFSPFDPPGKVEAEVVGFLKGQKLSKEQQQAIAALVAIGLGLFFLLSLPKK